MSRPLAVWVDAAPVRDHVRQLLQAGLTKPQIGRRSGIAPNTITALVEGVHGRGPSQRVRRATAAQLFSVEPELVGPEANGWVDTIGTTRRLRSLVALGWPVRMLAERAGLPTNTLWPILDERAGVIRVSTRERVIHLYDQLSRGSGPLPSTAGGTWARNRAARRAWPMPCVWSGGGIDDPDARPVDACYPRATARSRSFRILPAPETTRQWVAVVEHMLDDDPGLSTGQIAARFDQLPRVITSALVYASRLDLHDQLVANSRRRDSDWWVGQVEDLLAVDPFTTLAQARDRFGRKELTAELVAAGRADLRDRLLQNATRQKYQRTEQGAP